MRKGYKLFFLLFIVYFCFFFPSNEQTLEHYKFSLYFELFRNDSKNDNYKNENLYSLDEGNFQLEVFNVSLSKNGLVEIGEVIEIMGTYSLNFSPYRFIATQNWMDLGDDPESFHSIPVFVENFFYSRNITLDPSKFEVNESNILYGKVMLEIFDLETEEFYCKQNKSINGIRISKSKINSTISYQCPEIILSGVKTNVTFNFFNRNNEFFKFTDSMVQFILKDPMNAVVQEENLSTDMNGNINILLNTNSYESGGNYTLEIRTEETNCYKSTNITMFFNVYNESEVFTAQISEDEVYSSVPYDLKSLDLYAFLNFESIVFWNSSFSSGNFTKVSNFTYACNFTVPMIKNNYSIDVWAYSDMINLTLNCKINFEVIARPINIDLFVRRNLIPNKIELTASIFDSLKNCSIVDDQILNFYAYLNSNWNLIGKSKSNKGEACLIWQLPDNLKEGNINFKVELVNSSIYNDMFVYKNIELTELQVLTINPVKILNLFPIYIQFLIKNSSNLSNEEIKISINGINLYNIKIKPNTPEIFLILAPAYETRLDFLISYEGSDNKLNSYFFFQVEVRSDFFKIILGNSSFIFAILISSIFSFLCIKNRKIKNLGKLRIS